MTADHREATGCDECGALWVKGAVISREAGEPRWSETKQLDLIINKTFPLAEDKTSIINNQTTMKMAVLRPVDPCLQQRIC